MKKAGIVGGIGPASTLDYYSGIIDNCLNATGKYPKIVIDSIDMSEMCGYFDDNQYDKAADMIAMSVENLKAAGAEFAAIGANTPHIVFDMISERTDIPLISIVEETCVYSKEKGYKKIVILGTAFTMRSGMYFEAFEKHGIKSIAPEENDIEAIHNIIFPNLENGNVIMEDKKKMISIAEKYIRQYSADAVLLGCTEIPLMIKDGDLSVPVINTTKIHINAVSKEIMR